MTKNLKKGFTLIELLVVIAIIGILATITLSALGTARNRAMDAAIKSELSNIKSKSELYANNTGNFGDSEDDCDEGMFQETTDDGLDNLIESLKTRTTVTCATDQDTNANTWSVSAVLIANASESWCVDSSAFSGIGTDTDGDGNCD